MLGEELVDIDSTQVHNFRKTFLEVCYLVFTHQKIESDALIPRSDDDLFQAIYAGP